MLVLLITSFIGPARAAEEDNTKVLQGVISGAFNSWLQGIGDGLIKENPVQPGENETEENIGVFDSVKEPIPYASEEYLRGKSSDSIPLFVALSKIIILITALLCIGQVLCPEEAAGITAFFHGRATYYEPKEVIITGRNLALWFAVGPGLLLTMYFICNKVTGNIDTSALDQVVVSSENLLNYLFFGVTAKGVKIYMAIRSIIFLEVSEYWWVFGLLFAVRRTRWVAILGLEYLAIQVFTQPVIVTILTNVVAFTVTDGLIKFGPDMLIYGCCTFIIFCICAVAATAPIWIKLLSPSTLKTIVSFARGF
jgi:hypothetical protein